MYVLQCKNKDSLRRKTSAYSKLGVFVYFLNWVQVLSRANSTCHIIKSAVRRPTKVWPGRGTFRKNRDGL